jgi:hypothetical protein
VKKITLRRLDDPVAEGPIEALVLPAARSLLVLRLPEFASPEEIRGAGQGLGEVARALDVPALVVPHGYEIEAWETDA